MIERGDLIYSLVDKPTRLIYKNEIYDVLEIFKDDSVLIDSGYGETIKLYRDEYARLDYDKKIFGGACS